MRIYTSAVNREFNVPEALLAAIGSTRITAGQLEQLTHTSSDKEVVEWAYRVLEAEISSQPLTAATGDLISNRHPLDCLDCLDNKYYALMHPKDDTVVVGMVRFDEDADNGGHKGEGWQRYTPYPETGGMWMSFPNAEDYTVQLLDLVTAIDLKDIIDKEGSELNVVMLPYSPMAWMDPSLTTDVVRGKESVFPPEQHSAEADRSTSGLSAAVEGADVKADSDNKWSFFAIVDDLDNTAVLNLIRAKKEGDSLVVQVYDLDEAEKVENPAEDESVWVEDPELLTEIDGPTPPPMIKLEGRTLESVVDQVAKLANEGGETAAAAFTEKQREELAEEGIALPDGSFPIRNTHDLHNAIQAFGRAKDQEKAKRHIIKRARALKAVDSLPESWGVTAAIADHITGAERLRRYWSVGGIGGLKIMWGLPGDWRRCYRQLFKYLGPRAAGYCQNMHKRNTGIYTGSKFNASGSISVEEQLFNAVNEGTWKLETEL